MKYILTLLGGLIIGGVLVFFLLVGAPEAAEMPGAPVRPPEQGGDPPGTALVTLDEKFFDAVLGTIFRDMNAPSFQLTNADKGLNDGEANIRVIALQNGPCPNAVTLVPEGSGVKTGVRFIDGKVMAPLAFTGSYNAPLVGCIQLKGWARANMQLRFDEGQQTVYGEIKVESVNLDGAPPVIGTIATGLVQAAINQRVNPLEVLRAQQLTLAIPVKASDGTLRAKVKDVRAEVKNGSLLMHLTYDFAGQRGKQPQS